MSSPKGYPLERVQAPQLAGATEVRAFRFGPCRVIVSLDHLPRAISSARVWTADAPQGLFDSRWHLSISRADMLPSWAEIAAAKRLLLPPDLYFVLALPPESQWMNMARYALHLSQTLDETLIAQWRFEGEEARRLGYGTPSEERQP
jgi:hypothetical protein